MEFEEPISRVSCGFRRTGDKVKNHVQNRHLGHPEFRENVFLMRPSVKVCAFCSRPAWLQSCFQMSLSWRKA